MTLLTSRDTFNFLHLFLLLSLLLPVSVLLAQKPDTPKAKLSFCGSLHPQKSHEDIKPIGATIRDEDEVYSDRFGNYYSAEDLEMPKGSRGEQTSNGLPIKLETGYFNPGFDEAVPENVRVVFNQVLTDLLPIISQNTPTNSCTDNAELNIAVFWGDFNDPGSAVWERAGINTMATPLPEPNDGVLGTATPFYEFGITPGCEGLLIDRPFSKLNGGSLRRPGNQDGRILINSEVDLYSEENYPGQTITYNFDPSAGTVQANEFDLYTILLHEVMHVLGFASRIRPNLPEYSRWDLALNNLTDNSHFIAPLADSPFCYDRPDDFMDWVNNNWLNAPQVGFNGTDELAITNGTAVNSIAELDGLFSHLENHNGDFVNYVMRPSILAGVENRSLSNQEVDILCEMGYSTNSTSCTNCYAISTAESGNSVLNTNLCNPTQDLCTNQLHTFDMQDLINPSLSGGSINWGVPFASFNGMPTNDEQVSMSITGQSLEITVNISANGRLKVFFPYQYCDEDRTELSTYNFSVDNYCDICPTTSAEPCENISCYSDFENYQASDIGIAFGPTLRAISSNFTSSPDLRRQVNAAGEIVNTFVEITIGEIIALELNQPIPPGNSMTISGNIGIEPGRDLIIWGSENPMCSFNQLEAAIPYNCNATPINCDGAPDFARICIAQISDIAGTDNWPDPTNSPDFEFISRSFINEGSSDINHIYLVVSRGARGFFDDLSVSTSAPVAITVTEDAVPAAFCNGAIETISFQLCNNSSETTTFSAEVEETSGWQFFETFNDLELPQNGGCTTITIPVSSDINTPPGTYDFNLAITAMNQCGLMSSIQESFSLTIANPTPVISTLAEIPSSFCNGITAPITFEVCNDGEDPMTVSPLLEAIPGWEFTINAPITLLESGECVDFTYLATPDFSISEGDYELILEISAQNECGRTEEFFFPYTLTTEQCPQQFDCTAPNADLVGQTNCNRLLSNIATSSPIGPQCSAPGLVVSWPPNSLSNATIIVENELIIDKNYTFRSCEFIMRPNSKITVTNGSTLRITGSSTNQSWLHGCTALWEGINVGGNGRIITFNTRFQDAITAINATENARMRLAAVTMANNGIGVQISGEKSDINVEVEVFVGVQFIRENGLMPYTGTEPYTPNSIGVRTVGNFIANTFGYPTTETPQSSLWNRQRVIYRDLEVGISVEGGSTPTVVHSLFENTGIAFGNGIELTGTNVNVEAGGQGLVTFSNLDQGIRATETNYINASGNQFDGCRIGINSTGNGRVDINDNIFTNVGQTAISYRNEAIVFNNPISISNNSILLDSPGFTSGINLVHNRVKGKGSTRIDENNITLSGEAGIGIRLRGNSISLSGNNISTTNVNTATTGIEFSEGRNNTAVQNIISGMGANSSSVGITVGSQGEANPYLKCNLFNNLADGIVVLSTGTGLRIYDNDFAGEMNAGVYFGPQHTSFLRHPNGRNLWTANFQVGALVSDLPANTPNPATILDNQRWTIASNLFPPSVTVLNFPALANTWVIAGPAASFSPCAPSTDGFTSEPDENTEKSLSAKTAKTNVSARAEMLISPNPSLSAVISIQIPVLANNGHLSVMDIYGRTLRNIDVPADQTGTGAITLELPEKGVYFVVLREEATGKDPIVKRVIRN